MSARTFTGHSILADDVLGLDAFFALGHLKTHGLAVAQRGSTAVGPFADQPTEAKAPQACAYQQRGVAPYGLWDRFGHEGAASLFYRAD